ncbi:hypothetical protein [Leptospira yasudae]|nr:hypothetical protein [Leptospira yasudae]
MKQNMTKWIAVATLAMALVACKKSDDGNDDVVTAGLIYFLDQTSGNCASINKVNATQYFAILLSTPKGGCNQATISGTDLASAKAIRAAQYDGAIAIANSIGCSSAAITTITNAKNAAINAMTQATFDTSVSNTRYTPVADLRMELMGVLTNSNPAYTESEVMALNRMSVEQTIAFQYIQTAISTAGLEAACVTAFNNKRTADFKGFSFADPTAISKATITGIGLGICSYGNAAIPANMKCSTLSEMF